MAADTEAKSVVATEDVVAIVTTDMAEVPATEVAATQVMAMVEEAAHTVEDMAPKLPADTVVAHNLLLQPQQLLPPNLPPPLQQ